MNKSDRLGRMNDNSILYACLRPLVKTLIHIFFRRVRVLGGENIPPKGAVILIANHQNALMDPLVCCVLLKRQIHWLTRADVFRSPVISRLLHKLNMMPVYRSHDKSDIRKDNDPVFRECVRRLQNGSIVALFPEGTHHHGKYLKTFKKGVARIALAAIESKSCESLSIIPVGIDYENVGAWGYDLSISVGKPMTLEKYADFLASDSKAVQLITQEAQEALSREVVDCKSAEIATYFNILENVIGDILNEQMNSNASNLFLQMKQSGMLDEQYYIEEDWMAAAELLLEWEHNYHLKYQHGMMAAEVISFQEVFFSILWLVFLPVHLFHLPLRHLVLWLTRKYVRDSHFNSSFKLFAAPLIWIIGMSALFMVIRFFGFSLGWFSAAIIISMLYLCFWPFLTEIPSRLKGRNCFRRLIDRNTAKNEWLIICEKTKALIHEIRGR
ncbi:MAG: lysophospholipid acyltransferase family protein [Flavobacteriales bacterium]|nr:lysophospholipid acyltransferase family protein [Flavobacteriales bacterium]